MQSYGYLRLVNAGSMIFKRDCSRFNDIILPGCRPEIFDNWSQLGRVTRKPVFRVSDQVRHKPGLTYHRGWLLRGSGNCTIHVAKTKALISHCAADLPLLFSHNAKCRSRLLFSCMQNAGFLMSWLNLYRPPDSTS